METFTLYRANSDTYNEVYVGATGTAIPHYPIHSVTNQTPLFDLNQVFHEIVRDRRYLNQSEAFQTMLASEEVLRRDWDDPEEDELWADLLKGT